MIATPSACVAVLGDATGTMKLQQKYKTLQLPVFCPYVRLAERQDTSRHHVPLNIAL